ncbi:MAG TPA: polymer-forming cytoskeletal protein [Bryobacteraceae bacterium]
MFGKTMERDSRPLVAPQPASTPGPEHPPAPPAPVLQTPKVTAAVGKTMRIRGEIHCDEELYLDGEVEGTLEVRQRLTIGPNGKVKANVKAKELVVSGSIQGDVQAADRISIMKGASIVGDLKTAGIVIEDGAYFKGGIDILRPENKTENKTPEPAAKIPSKAVSAQSPNIAATAKAT